METLYVVLYGGPGTGKSTTAAVVFGVLKQLGRNVEIAHEYAKDLTWEGRFNALGFAPYVAAKQMWREQRLNGQVEAVITDTSTLLGLVYQGEGYSPPFKRWLLDEYRQKNTMNFFLQRDENRPYNPAGRSQTESEADILSGDILAMLHREQVPYVPLKVDKDTNSHVDAIVNNVLERLDAS